MAILRFPISPSEHCIIAIFKFTNFKFWILIKNYIATNKTSVFSDKMSVSFGIELKLGPSRIKGLDFGWFVVSGAESSSESLGESSLF
jgi:hypothetical protein